jgi:hypothetical protein
MVSVYAKGHGPVGSPRCDTIGVSMVSRSMCLVTLVACGTEPATPPGPDPSIDGTPVETFETTSCSTGDVLALSVQIADEINCMDPTLLTRFEEMPGIVFTGSAVLPYLGADARDDLYAATAGAASPAEITSAFRTVVQQYLLRRWFELGRCGITAAAEPGRSNHESGRALDLSNFGDWIAAFDAHGWAHDVPGDDVHFDHLASPDIRGADILAFQRLWNRNAPDDPIAEDGDYGPTTEERVKLAPAEGFGIGACE